MMPLGHLFGKCLDHVHPKGDPEADLAHAGGTIAPVWLTLIPWSMVFPRRSWRKLLTMVWMYLFKLLPMGFGNE